MGRQVIRLGISTCPNDTFAFHGLIQRRVDWRGLTFDVQLLDIEQLNRRLAKGELDVAKASFHSALYLADRFFVLQSGAALGFGVGPLLLADAPGKVPSNDDEIVLCPGAGTTAALLFQLLYPNTAEIRHVVFSQIMPALQREEADFGVCIHEGRFTWRESGLACVADLGETWEAQTGCPLPLGGILASRDLPLATLKTVDQVIRQSIESSLESPQSALPTMRQYAQEMSDEVLMQHVELYVNQWTVRMGDVGQRSLDVLAERAMEVGLPANKVTLLEG